VLLEFMQNLRNIFKISNIELIQIELERVGLL